MGLKSFLRRIGRSNRIFPRKLSLTREGKYFLLITFGVGFAAMNSGNNLLYLTLGLLLSMIIVSGIMSELSLRNIEVQRRFPDHVHANHGALVAVQIVNTKRFFSSFSIEIEEMFTKEIPHSPCYFLHLKANERREAYFTIRFPNRGIFKSEGYRISTRFPFTFFKKSRNIYCERDFVVYPELVSVVQPRLPAAVRQFGERERPRLGAGEDYYGLREFREGDEASHIHWKATAKRRKTIVREFEHQDATKVFLRLHNHFDEFAGFSLVDLECAISTTASLARKLIVQGMSVGLSTLTDRLPPQNGHRQLVRIYRALSTLEIVDRNKKVSLDSTNERLAITITPSVGGALVRV